MKTETILKITGPDWYDWWMDQWKTDSKDFDALESSSAISQEEWDTWRETNHKLYCCWKYNNTEIDVKSKEEEKMKHCIDCKHFEPAFTHVLDKIIKFFSKDFVNDGLKYGKCKRSKTSLDYIKDGLVDDKIGEYVKVERVSLREGACGPDGKHFEQK